MDHKETDVTRAGQGGVGIWSHSPQDKVGTVETVIGSCRKEVWHDLFSIKLNEMHQAAAWWGRVLTKFIVRIRCTLKAIPK